MAYKHMLISFTENNLTVFQVKDKDHILSIIQELQPDEAPVHQNSAISGSISNMIFLPLQTSVDQPS